MFAQGFNPVPIVRKLKWLVSQKKHSAYATRSVWSAKLLFRFKQLEQSETGVSHSKRFAKPGTTGQRPGYK